MRSLKLLNRMIESRRDKVSDLRDEIYDLEVERCRDYPPPPAKPGTFAYLFEQCYRASMDRLMSQQGAMFRPPEKE